MEKEPQISEEQYMLFLSNGDKNVAEKNKKFLKDYGDIQKNAPKEVIFHDYKTGVTTFTPWTGEN